MTEAKYLDGKPQNLPAAANDALTWLEFFNQVNLSLDDEHRWRLNQTIKTLREFLPSMPAMFEETPKPPLYGAAVDAVISSWIKEKSEQADDRQ